MTPKQGILKNTVYQYLSLSEEQRILNDRYLQTNATTMPQAIPSHSMSTGGRSNPKGFVVTGKTLKQSQQQLSLIEHHDAPRDGRY